MNNVVNKQYKNSNKKSKYKYDYTTTTFYIIDNEPGYLYHYENNLANYCNIDDDIDINDNNKENFQNLVNTNKMVAKYYLDLNNNKNYFLNNEILKYNDQCDSNCEVEAIKGKRKVVIRCNNQIIPEKECNSENSKRKYLESKSEQITKALTAMFNRMNINTECDTDSSNTYVAVYA